MPDRPSHDIAIIIEENAWERLTFEYEPYLSHIIQSSLDHLGIIFPLEISVLLTNNQHIQVLNKEYRGQDKPTNVLSFPSLDPEDLTSPQDYSEPLIIGDIVLAYEKIMTEAQEQNKSFQNHLAHLTIHGLLHLLGYDHEEDDEAEIMEALEVTLLDLLNISNPYQ
jgi:probable rRNA maturation factor